MVDVRRIVAQVNADAPIPDTVDALDPFTRERIERDAAMLGVAPADHLAAVREASADAAESWADAHAIARESRRPSW